MGWMGGVELLGYTTLGCVQVGRADKRWVVVEVGYEKEFISHRRKRREGTGPNPSLAQNPTFLTLLSGGDCMTLFPDP